MTLMMLCTGMKLQNIKRIYRQNLTLNIRRVEQGAVFLLGEELDRTLNNLYKDEKKKKECHMTSMSIYRKLEVIVSCL